MADERDDRERRRRDWYGNPERRYGWNTESPDDPEFRSYRPRVGQEAGRYGDEPPEGWRSWSGYPTPDDPEFRRYEAGEGEIGRWERPGPHTGRGPRNYRRSDERIREDVCERLTHHGHIDAREIDVQVENGEVTLKGVVMDRQTKRLAERVAESVAGVHDVHNQLHLSDDYVIHQGAGMTTGYGRIRTGMHVAGADGQTVGRVKEVREHEFLVDRSMARDIYVPYEAVHTVSENWLSLRLPAGEVDRQGWRQAEAA